MGGLLEAAESYLAHPGNPSPICGPSFSASGVLSMVVACETTKNYFTVGPLLSNGLPYCEIVKRRSRVKSSIEFRTRGRNSLGLKLDTVSFENLRVERLIVHRLGISSHQNQTAPSYSSELTVLDTDGAVTFQKRLTTALGTDSQCIEMSVKDESAGSTFQKTAALLDSDNAQFVSISVELAEKLTSEQRTANIKPGLAVIMTGTVGPRDEHRVAIILKAETDSGFVTEGGKHVILKFIDNLFLTPQQRLYKVGAFKEISTQVTGTDGLRKKGDFNVFVFDHLLSGSTQEAALYFFRGFLGCDTAPSAKRQTRDFYTLTRDFIDKLDLSTEKRIDHGNDLTAYLRTVKASVQVREFADQYFDPIIKAQYCTHMQAKKFPMTAVVKDTTLIVSKLRTRRIKFSSTVRITGPSDTFRDLVKVSPTGTDGWTEVKIKGTVEEQT